MGCKGDTFGLGLGQHGIGTDDRNRRILPRPAFKPDLERVLGQWVRPAKPAKFIPPLIGCRPEMSSIADRCRPHSIHRDNRTHRES